MPLSSATTPPLHVPVPRELTIYIWPLAEGDGWTWGVLAGAAAVFGISAYATQSVATGGVLAAFCLLAAWRLWLPVRYELDGGGISRTVLGKSRRIAWSAIAAVRRRNSGVLLMRDPSAGALAVLRGIYLPYQSQRGAILELMEFYLAGRAELE